MAKKVFIPSIALVIVLVAAQMATAGTATISPSGGGATRFDDFAGGEFYISQSSGVPDKDAPNWIAFCVERNESFQWNTQYEADWGTDAVSGGISGGSGDPVSAETGYIYTRFRQGKLYDTTAASVGTDARKMDAAAFQIAAWWFEGEFRATEAISLTDETSITAANIKDVFGAFTSDVNLATIASTARDFIDEAQASGWTTARSVRIMNPYEMVNGVRVNKQSQLMMVPLPSAAYAGLVLLGGLGLARIRRRRQRRNSLV